MSEPAPFSFKAARPASKGAHSQIEPSTDPNFDGHGNWVGEGLDPRQPPADEAVRERLRPLPREDVTRRRRGPNKVQEEGDDLTIFLDIVTRLQSLTPSARKKIVAALGRVFA